MLITSLLGLTAWFSAATSAVAGKVTRCGTKPSVSFRELAAGIADREARGDFDSKEGPIEIDTYFHVIAASDSTSEADGYVTDTKLEWQLKALNEGYEPHQISFNLIKTTRTINKEWATEPYYETELEMKKALRQGDYKTLNVYFVADLEDLLGVCDFPEEVKEGSDQFIRDGCIVVGGTVPGGIKAPYNLGATLIHEVGHFMGLFHTFEDGCDGGDSIADTPAQSSPTENCPVARDSCPNHPGTDPIHNYMDYSSDICLDEFTPGQEKRMRAMWSEFRANK